MEEVSRVRKRGATKTRSKCTEKKKKHQPHLEPVKRLGSRRARQLARAPRHEDAVPGLLADDAALVVEHRPQAQRALTARFRVAAACDGDEGERLGADRAALVGRRHGCYWRAAVACLPMLEERKGTAKGRDAETEEKREVDLARPSMTIDLSKNEREGKNFWVFTQTYSSLHLL